MTMMGKERILIVGTDYDIQELHDYFSSKGYRVFVASNIVEGTRLHKKYRPSQVFTELNVGEESGIQMTMDIRRYDRQAGRETRITLMHDNELQEGANAENLMADAIYNKRSSPAQLMHKLRREAA